MHEEIQSASFQHEVIDLRKEISDELRLAIDTSTAQLTTALVRGKEVLGVLEESAKQNHSIKLVPNIARLMEEHQLPMSALQAIAAGYGPGSYTGVRIGVTVAKTLAWSLRIPVTGVSSIEALAFRTASTGGWLQQSNKRVWIIPLINARRGRAYTGLYQLYDHQWQPLISDRIRHVSDWLQWIAHEVSNLGGSDRKDAWKDRNQDREAAAGSIFQADIGQPERDESKQFERAEMEPSDPLQSIAFSGIDQPDHIVVTGEAEGFQEEFNEFVKMTAVSCEIQQSIIHAADIALLAGHRQHLAKSGDDVHAFVPNYTQVAEAEAKLREKIKH